MQNVFLREVLNWKVACKKSQRKKDVMVCIMHPLKIVTGILAILHELMVVMKVEILMVPET